MPGDRGVTLYLGDCLEIMPGIPDGSVDLIFTDPPYPYIKRPYGYWTEETWLPMMQEAVRQGRRVLKPHGSMVMVLQPNSEKVGKMRLWLWRFMLWCGEYWGIVQDAYWWNIAAMPNIQASIHNQLRPSIKPCVWLGNPDCYKNQWAVMWSASESAKMDKRIKRMDSPSGHSVLRSRMNNRAKTDGVSTPYNLIPVANTDSQNSAGANGHGAGTPLKLTDWWLRYLSKPGDTILDPFSGTATTGVAALKLGRKYIGIEKMDKYHPIAQERLQRVEEEMRQPRQAELPQ